jgi:hypothetical protein
MYFISEFKVIEDKEWLENKAGMLIECGKLFGSKAKFLEPTKRRVMIIRTIDYMAINKFPAAHNTYAQ